MPTQQPNYKQRISAILNIIAGILFLAAAFHLLTGQGGIDWLSLIAGVIFVAGGLWGLWKL